ncbi:MAG: dTDP-4-dehydrorhamnose reductase [Gammaproteobacteria bacterium]
MRVLVTGAGGQLGRALLTAVPQGYRCTSLTHTELDITNSAAVDAAMEFRRPDVIINTAAYTAVDKAETEPELAYAVNAQGPANLASAAKNRGCRLVHISTDFVFDGKKSQPYTPYDPTGPLSVYGASKLQGEQAMQAAMHGNYLILRTSWIYAAAGHNFVRTMLKLLDEREQVRVVADQVGAPSWAGSCAQAIWCAVEKGLDGVHHWTDAGVASWYDFAVAIAEEGAACGLFAKTASIVPITTAEYPTPARRPAYSVLDRGATELALGMRPGHWRSNLRTMLRELRND